MDIANENPAKVLWWQWKKQAKKMGFIQAQSKGIISHNEGLKIFWIEFKLIASRENR